MLRQRFHLSLTSVIVLIAVGVLLPVMLAAVVGIVALVIARDAGGIVTGVLVLCFTVTAMGSALITVVLAGRKARLARLQADFLANVSHELRTPLSAIRLYAQTLESGRLAHDPRQTAECVATILREAEWLDVLIERVLTWRASARDLMKLNLETRPLSATVESAVERFRRMLAPGEAQLSCVLASRRAVRHDPTAMTAVVLNLLTNAYKYTGADKRIAVRVRDDGEAVAVDVSDNGIGLAPEQIRRVFRPFYRVADAEGGDAGGIGLGLAIAEHLVRRQGGAIRVVSEKGRGSTFTIRLPAAGGSP